MRNNGVIDRNFMIGVVVALTCAGAGLATVRQLRPRPVVLPPVPVLASRVQAQEILPPPRPLVAPVAPPIAPSEPTPLPKPALQLQRLAHKTSQRPKTVDPTAATVRVRPASTGVVVDAASGGGAAAQSAIAAPIAPLNNLSAGAGQPVPVAVVFDADEVDSLPVAQVQPAPHYPHWARQLGETATVIASFVVTAAGKVERLSVRVTAGDPRFAAEVGLALAQWRFEPARRAGVAVAVNVEQQFHFDLQP
ncbi:MAG: energy transducer TonB [Myxococcales bacterium]|nr:energy transducer TonB [Myxococcales bacterium]